MMLMRYGFPLGYGNGWEVGWKLSGRGQPYPYIEGKWEQTHPHGEGGNWGPFNYWEACGGGGFDIGGGLQCSNQGGVS